MPTASPLILDKLSLVHELSVPDSEGLTSIIRQHINDRSLHLRYLGAWYHNYDYLNNYHLYIDGHPTSPALIQTIHKYTNANLRVEWTPNTLGQAGNRILWAILEELFSAEYDNFLHNAKVSRIDIATDIRPVTPQSFWASARGLQLGDVRTGRRGEVTGYNLGSRRGALYYCIYNRDPDDGHRISSDPYTTRFEARVSPECTLAELSSIRNPFERLTVVNSVDPIALDSAPFRYKAFLALVVLYGLQAALLQIPRHETRVAYRQWLENILHTNWFDDALLWRGKRQMLNVLALPSSVRPRYVYRRRRRHNAASA